MKKLLIILTIIVNILLISLIPINTFALNIYMPEIISTILSEILLILNIALLIKTHKIYKSLLIICLVSIIFGFIGTYCNPYWNSLSFKNVSYKTKEYDTVLTKNQALADLEYSMKYLRKLHPSMLKINLDVEEQYKIVKNNIETKDIITVNYLSKEIESIFSKLEDAHTLVIGNYTDTHKLKELEKHNKNKEVLKKVNDIDINELFNQNKIYYSYEMEEDAFNQFKQDLLTLEGLDKLEIDTEEIKYTYELNKKEKEYKYTKEDFLKKDEYNEYNKLTPKAEKSFVRYEIDKENNLAILYLDKCKNNDEYKRVLKEMFEQIKENNIRNIAIDLRNNGGGNSTVFQEFLKYTDIDKYQEIGFDYRLGTLKLKIKSKEVKNKKNKTNWNGNIYALTSIDTFSAATMFAQYLKDNNIGTIIGETSKNSQNSYGDVASFLLPNSKLYMQISTKKWYRINNTGDFIEPDINCESKEAIFKLYDTIKSTSEN